MCRRRACLGFGLAAGIACSASDGSGGAGGSIFDGASGSGGNAIADASFGGHSESGAGGSTAADGSDDGEAGADAPPFVCDASGPLDCSPSQAGAYSCAEPKPNLASTVGAAIKLVLSQHPEWFDYSKGFPCCPLALEPVKFVDAVIAAIVAAGECAQRDPNNSAFELVVKHNNKCSEQWVVLTSANMVRNPPKYQVACVPAWL